MISPENPRPRRWMIAPGIAIGLLILVLAIVLKPDAKTRPAVDRSRLVEIQVLQLQEVSPMVSGFGRAMPKHSWEAVAEVTGRLLYRNPQLEKGRLLAAGTSLLEIDPLEYELKLAQAEASKNSSAAQLKRLDQQEVNITSTLKIEKQRLALANKEYKRKAQLIERRLISSSEYEKEKQSLLAQTNVVQELENQLSLMNDDRKVTEAQLRVDEASLEDARRHLEKTKVLLPFDARIAEVNVEMNQVVPSQSVMVVAHRIDTMEVEAHVSMHDMKKLISSFRTRREPGELPSIETLKLPARVVLNSSGLTFEWPAAVTRINETINPDQATVGVFLEVQQNLRQSNAAVKPPLAKGMYVKASITGFPSQQFVVPERALHGSTLYLMDAEGKLNIVVVNVLFRSDKGVAVAGPLNAGDRLVLNDLIPAIEGMALRSGEQSGD